MGDTDLVRKEARSDLNEENSEVTVEFTVEMSPEGTYGGITKDSVMGQIRE